MKTETLACLMRKIFIHCKNLLFYSHPQFLIAKRHLRAGQKCSEQFILTRRLVDSFIEISGDLNPIHQSSVDISKRPIVHGALLNSLVSRVIGTHLPGPGSIVVKEELNFPSSCFVEDEVTVEVVIRDVRKIIVVDFTCTSSKKVVVLWGYAKVVLSKA